jgi:hypothetical protein
VIAGDLTVPAGIRPDHHGLITGSLVIEPTRLAGIHGMVAASSSITGGTVQVFGSSACWRSQPHRSFRML